ncbi:hypothetical protein [Mesorhizobium sp. B2-7-2]|uniref:hypothetical protein n=1 Tax=Mesorhizobium sp. B2-7-2 TaxID=2589908 RepID=UPI0015E4104E|nr:hypothetical protein [Mesorhizobium sp. B2-7-2]
MAGIPAIFVFGAQGRGRLASAGKLPLKRFTVSPFHGNGEPLFVFTQFQTEATAKPQA